MRNTLDTSGTRGRDWWGQLDHEDGTYFVTIFNGWVIVHEARFGGGELAGDLAANFMEDSLVLFAEEV